MLSCASGHAGGGLGGMSTTLIAWGGSLLWSPGSFAVAFVAAPRVHPAPTGAPLLCYTAFFSAQQSLELSASVALSDAALVLQELAAGVILYRLLITLLCHRSAVNRSHGCDSCWV